MLVQNHILPSSSSCLSLRAFMVLMCLTCTCFCSQKVDLNYRGKKMANILLISITVLQIVVTQMQIQASGGDTVMLEGLWQSLLLSMPEEKVQARRRGIKSDSSKQKWFHGVCSEIVVFHPLFQMKQVHAAVLASLSFWLGLWLITPQLERMKFVHVLLFYRCTSDNNVRVLEKNVWKLYRSLWILQPCPLPLDSFFGQLDCTSQVSCKIKHWVLESKQNSFFFLFNGLLTNGMTSWWLQ